MAFARRLRESVIIYERVGKSAGGKAPDEYRPLRTTGAAVRDESMHEYEAAEAADVEHVLVFTLRGQSIPSDGLIGWRGQLYRIRRIDQGDYAGRFMRVTAYNVKPRATLGHDEVSADGSVRI